MNYKIVALNEEVVRLNEPYSTKYPKVIEVGKNAIPIIPLKSFTNGVATVDTVNHIIKTLKNGKGKSVDFIDISNTNYDNLKKEVNNRNYLNWLALLSANITVQAGLWCCSKLWLDWTTERTALFSIAVFSGAFTWSYLTSVEPQKKLLDMTLYLYRHYK